MTSVGDAASLGGSEPQPWQGPKTRHSRVKNVASQQGPRCPMVGPMKRPADHSDPFVSPFLG
jgi:hypothetical protein